MTSSDYFFLLYLNTTLNIEMNNQIKNIKRQEENLNKIQDFLNKLEETITEWKDLKPVYLELLSYYQSQQWMNDYEDSNSGKFSDFHCGVLSQDSVYDLIQKQQDLGESMIQIVTDYTKEQP